MNFHNSMSYIIKQILKNNHPFITFLLRFSSLVSLIIIIFSSLVFGQYNQIRFDHISIEQGLSQSSVLSIAQDNLGFMWFATQDGLNRFDGYTFTVYSHDPLDSNSISDIGIQKLYVDNTGNLWVITLSGKLERYDYEHDLFFHYHINKTNTFDKPSERISSIVEDRTGQLWVCTGSGNIYHYNQIRDNFIYQQFSKSNNTLLSNSHAQCLYADKEGILWIGTWEGLIEIDLSHGNIKKYQNIPGDEQSLGGNMVFSITEDAESNLWIATADGGVSVLNKTDDKFKVYRNNKTNPKSLSSDRVMNIFLDSYSNIWIGTIDKGLDLFQKNDNSFIHYRHVPSSNWSISNGAVMSIYEDRSGTLWFGTLSGGINRFDRKSQNFLHISHNASYAGSISNNIVLSICEDHTGALWVGTDGGGLNIRKPGTEFFEHYFQNPSGVGSNSITAIFEDRYGKIWIGTDPGVNTAVGGVFTYDRNSNSFIPFKDFILNGGGITAFYEDSFGDFWLGSSVDGIRRIISGSDNIKKYKHDKNNPGSLSGNSVFAIHEDSYGDLWIGTIGKGVNRFNRKNESFETFINNSKDSSSISNNSVWCFGEDINGNLWMGTWGGGLNRFNKEDETFKTFTIKDGLPSNVIYSIIPDDDDNFWLSTGHGLAKFNTLNFSCKTYDKSNGLQNIEFNQGAYCQGKDGLYYFGGTNGITTFYPENIKENQFIPPIVLTNFHVFDKPLHLEKSINSIDEITLSYDQNFFSFEFAALDYTAPDKNQYAYKLDGVDEDWVYTGSRRFANYTDVAPGEYTFRVIGSNNDGVWNNKEAAVTIIVTPPFWQTWWFRILVIFSLGGLLYSFYRYRLNKLLEVERTRVRIARDLHDEVSATITGIVYFSNAIANEIGKSITPMLKKLLNLINESATEVQESMSDIIWSINPENDKWETILPKLRRYSSDLCESKDIKYSIQISNFISNKELSMERRRNFWLIFKEMVTNAVKHSNCSDLKITITNHNDLLSLIIEDNGTGFEPDRPTDRNGVKNIYSRSTTLKGNVKLTTKKGKGTKWELKFPL